MFRRSSFAAVAALTFGAAAIPVTGQEQPENCNASSVGVRLVPTINLVPIEPNTCVIPGQEITYRTAPFVSPNPPEIFQIRYCDVVGGQLGVTFPNWQAALPPGMLRPDQFVPVAGYGAGTPDAPDIPQFGNGQSGASDPIPLFVAPEVYVVDEAHADVDGFLRARSDYGLTSFLNMVGVTQANGTVLGDPPQMTANATITNALPMCSPRITIVKTASPEVVCEGIPTEVVYTYVVTNTSFGPDMLSGALPNLTNVVVEDDTCAMVEGPFGDDGDGLLNPGEEWTYTCTTTVSTTTTNVATVTANAIAPFPGGGPATIDTVTYMDTATATVESTPVPSCEIDGPTVLCPGESNVMYTVTETSMPPLPDATFSWEITGAGLFCDGTTSATGDTVCVNAGAVCDGQFTLTVTVETNEGGVPCTSTCTYVVTLVDNEPPMITCPDPITVPCPQNVPDPDTGLVSASDDCPGDVMIIHMGDESDGNTCPEIITRTYRAIDFCGNSSECTQLITVNDEVPPQIGCPDPVTVECPADVPDPDPSQVTVKDNCTDPENIVVTHIGDESDGNTCPEIITRTYRATDECGNTTDCTQLITVDDTTPPTVTCPDPVTVECPTDVPAPDPDSVTASDNCSLPENITIEFVSDESDGNTCPETITRTYRATDECGNAADCTQVITVDDTTPPTVTCPDPLMVECPSDVPDPDPGLVSVSDNCSDVGAITVEFVSDVPDGSTCPVVITRTYRATDECGNAAECTQLITVDDMTPPSITCPDPLMVECASDVPDPDPGLVIVSDNCSDVGAITVEFVSDVPDGSTCPLVITRTYRATDECGNAAECTQTITVDDTTAPTITCPDPVTVECVGDVPPVDPAGVGVSDNCSDPQNIQVEHVGDVPADSQCPPPVDDTGLILEDSVELVEPVFGSYTVTKDTRVCSDPLNGATPCDPFPADGLYTYVYRLTNSAGSGNSVIGWVLDPKMPGSIVDAGFLAGPGVLPSAVLVEPDGSRVEWQFFADPIDPGEASVELYVVSALGPAAVEATILGDSA
ncbi:MAG: HYR-like domain-containing protein, partial [Planctomycetota bacterium]